MPATELSLDSLISRTDAVAEAIAAGDWQLASRLEAERRRLMERYVEAECRVSGGLERIRGELAELIDRNNLFLGEVHHQRRQILREASTVKRGRAAATEYDRQNRAGASLKSRDSSRK